jgi:hypothetical protein
MSKIGIVEDTGTIKHAFPRQLELSFSLVLTAFKQAFYVYYLSAD